MLRKLIRALPVLLLFSALPSALQAQYFGRQKVQYEEFDWQVLKTPHFDIHYYPEEKIPTDDAARMAERWYSRLSREFQHEFKKKPLILYADHADFQQTNVIGQQLNEGTGGVTEGLRSRVIMPYTGVYADNNHVLGHELVHVFQYDLAASPTGGGSTGMERLPLWLVEGMAEYLSLGRDDALTSMWLRDAALRGDIPTIDQLTRDTRYFPYRYGQALWAYVAGRWGDRAVAELFRYATRAGWEPALERVLGMNGAKLSEQWITAIRSTYLPLIAGRQRPQDAADRVIYESDIGAFNLSPVISPDGRYVAYYTRKGLFSIDLYVADARTGKTVKKLTSPNRSPHFDALSFINSAGTWSPDGQKFAFPVFAEGDMELAILDVNSTNIEKQLHLPDIGAIANPAWSPDGSRIAFSGMARGVSDLFVLDLASGNVEQMTNDRYADLQPTWSPDGRTIAEITDRGPTTDFDKLVFGPMNLATIDVGSKDVKLLSPFPGSRHINPQYSPDGKDIYFVSDYDGFSDLYRMQLASGDIYRLTHLATGVSGITLLSPAFSVAQRSGRILFSAFEASGYNIYGIDPEKAVGERVPSAAKAAVVAAELLPPIEGAGTGLIAEYLADATTGLPGIADKFPTEPYKSRLTLDYLGQPSFGVGTSRFGPQVSGGVSAYFSDMLGDHQLGAAIQAQGTVKDIGGQVFYANSAHRWNWAASVGHIPYLSGQQYGSYGPGGTQEVDQYIQRVFVDQAAGYAYRPFSQTRRLEFSGGFTRYSFDTELRRYLLDFQGNIISQTRESIDRGLNALNLFEASAAIVGDNTNFGFTSPVVGQRYRAEVAPTFGTLQYETALLDYRRYFFKQPITFAVRAMHYGRYGHDADNGRLQPLFLGYETFIRGYAVESFTGAECSQPTGAAAGTNVCPEFDRLIGSRIAVANMELRIPLFGIPGLGLITLPFLPTEIAPFVDAGVAWWGNSGLQTDANGLTVFHSKPTLSFDRNTAERVPVFSTGVAARFNILGYLVLEAYYAYPFQRPAKGAHWGFQISPGW